MPESDVSVEVHATATSDALRRLADKIQNRTTVNKEVAIQIFSWIQRNFQAEGSLNESWAQLSPKYAKWKEKRYGIGKKILERDGQLRDSYGNFGYDNDTATVGTSLLYAPFHELGAPERNLPRRPMLPTIDIATKDAVDVYAHYLRTSINESGLTG